MKKWIMEIWKYDYEIWKYKIYEYGDIHINM